MASAAFGGAGGVVEQLFVYQVLGQLIGGLLAPLVQAEANLVWPNLPNVPLAPAQLADAVVRGELSEGDAAAQAVLSGIDSTRFHTLYRIAGEGPAPFELAAALRRGFIDEATYLQGIRESRTRDEWADLIRRLATADPAPDLALRADLKGQLDKGAAQALYRQLGGNPEHYDVAFDVEGAGPSPLEAYQAFRRGIIPESGVGADSISAEQAVHESQYRNKWQPVFRALSEYLPPPRTIVAMYKEGALTEDQAKHLLDEHGLSAELVSAYIASAKTTKTGRHRELAESTVLALYRDQLIDRAAAATMLEALTYTPDEAGFILSVEDMRVEEQAMRGAASRVRSLYVRYRLTDAEAAAALGQVHVPTANAATLLAIWSAEREAARPQLTPAQIERAFNYSILDEGTALTHLEQLGYTPGDAFTLLELAKKGRLNPATGAPVP